jgi:hypothetical protein
MQESLWAAEDRLLHRPIYGGVFGTGRYALASMPCVSRGLHSIRYMVVEPRGGAVLSVAEDKTEALAGARKILSTAGQLQADLVSRQLEMWPESAANESRDALKPVSRRRREVFEKSGGKCHYCGTRLMLDGKWHVEHMFPRALGGSDASLNLVAACVACNLEKSDRTALEYFSNRA